MKCILELHTEFYKNSNKEEAKGQKAYLKNKLEFFGMTSPIRRSVQKSSLLIKQ